MMKVFTCLRCSHSATSIYTSSHTLSTHSDRLPPPSLIVSIFASYSRVGADETRIPSDRIAQSSRLVVGRISPSSSSHRYCLPIAIVPPISFLFLVVSSFTIRAIQQKRKQWSRRKRLWRKRYCGGTRGEKRSVV